MDVKVNLHREVKIIIEKPPEEFETIEDMVAKFEILELPGMRIVRHLGGKVRIDCFLNQEALTYTKISAELRCVSDGNRISSIPFRDKEYHLDPEKYYILLHVTTSTNIKLGIEITEKRVIYFDPIIKV